MFVIVCRGSKVADYEVFTGKKRDRFGKQTGQIWEANGTDLGSKRDRFGKQTGQIWETNGT